jgi:hypothetical protein
VHQEDRHAARGAALLVGHVQDTGVYPFQHLLNA